jgi:hypothetical protein
MSYNYGGNAYGYQILIAGHARNADCIKAFLDVANRLGMQDCHLVQCTPAKWTMKQQGNWAICQSLTDNTSPKLLGYLGYNGTARQHSDIFNDSAGMTVDLSVKSYNVGGAFNTSVSPSAYFFLKSTLLTQQVDTLIQAVAGKYAITVNGADSLGTVLQLLIDSVPIGSVTLPTLGAANRGASSTFGAATPLAGSAGITIETVGGVNKIVWTPSAPGPHSLSIVLSANTGNAPGVQTIRLDAIG